MLPSVVGSNAEPKDNVFIGDLPHDMDENIIRRVMESMGSIIQMRVIRPPTPEGKSAALVQFATVDQAMWAVSALGGTTPDGFPGPLKMRFAESSEDKIARQWNQFSGKSGGKDRAAPYPAPFSAGGKGGGWNSWGGPRSPSDGGIDWFAAGAACASAQRFGGKGGKPSGKKGGSRGGGPNSNAALIQMEAMGVIPSPKNAPPDCVVYVKNLPIDCTDLEVYRMFSPFGALSSARALWGEDGNCKGIGFVNFVEPAGAQKAIAALNGFQMANGSILGCEIKRVTGSTSDEAATGLGSIDASAAATGLGAAFAPAASATGLGATGLGAAGAAATAPSASGPLATNTGAAAQFMASLGDVLGLAGAGGTTAGSGAVQNFEQQMRLLQMQLGGGPS